MADEIVGLKIQVDTNAGEAVGSLRSQLKAAQAEVAALSDKFGSTSKEAIEAAKRAAELKDKIGDAKALTDAFNPDAKFKSLNASLSGVAGGFAAVQGAMGLFGSESKELEKQLLKVQSAMALSQGLQSIGESVDSFKQLGAVIKSQVVTAFSTLRGAIIATGIGALAVTLGVIITHFEQFKKAVYNLIPGLESFIGYVGKLVDKFTDFVGITSEAERSMERLKATNNKYLEALDRNIKVLEAYGNREDEVYKQKQARITLELNQLQQAKDRKIQLSEDELKREKELINEREILRIQESNRIAKENEEAAKKAAELRKQKRLEDSKEIEPIDPISGLTKTQSDEMNKTIISGMQARKVEEINIQSDLTNAKKLLRQEEYQTAMQFADLIGGLADASAELVGRNTAEGKALSIATTLISTWLTAQKAYESQFAPVADVSSPIRGAIAAATAVASGLARVAAINSVKIPNSSGGGGSASVGGYSFSSGGSAPISPTANVTTTQLNQSSINQLRNNTVKAYVVESDISDSQYRQRRIIDAATFD